MSFKIALTLGQSPMLEMDIYRESPTGSIEDVVEHRQWEAGPAMDILNRYYNGEESIRLGDSTEALLTVKRELHKAVKEVAQLSLNYDLSLGMVIGYIIPPSQMARLGSWLGPVRPTEILENDEIRQFVKDMWKAEVMRAEVAKHPRAQVNSHHG